MAICCPPLLVIQILLKGKTMINPTVIALVKLGSNFAVSSGVSTIVGYAAKSSVPKVAPLMIRKFPIAVRGFHAWQKVAIPAGAVALAGMAADKAVKYAEEQIDLNVMTAEKWVAKVKESVDKANAASDSAKSNEAK
jgi:hypothetical protein